MFESMYSMRNGKVLTIEAVVDSTVFPNPYAIYASGFWKCSEEIILRTEESLQFRFPWQLRSYYAEIGVGTVRGQDEARSFSFNNVLIPTHIPELINGTCGWMAPYTQIEPEAVPFFERDVDLFFCVKPKSANPNAVHWMWGEKICDSLDEFFNRIAGDPSWPNPSGF